MTRTSDLSGAGWSVAGEDGREIFLSIGIPTYNRSEWLSRCFQQLASILRASEFRGEVEILISDNHSTDDTARVIGEAVHEFGALCPVRAFTQPVNLGAEPNFKFLYDQSRGKYLWLCADDDELAEAEFDRMLRDVREYEPDVCVSSFTNPASTQNQIHLDSGKEVELVTRVEDALLRFSSHTMVTQYVLRRRELSPEEEATSEAAAQAIVWFCGVAMMLFVRGAQRLLLRTGEIARDTRTDAQIRVSPRVFGLIRDSVFIGLGNHPRRAELEPLIPVITPETYLVGHLFRTALGDSIADRDIAYEDFRDLKKNLRKIAFSSWRNFIKVPVVLVLFPITHRLNLSRKR